jgi:hypothetical protein
MEFEPGMSRQDICVTAFDRMFSIAPDLLEVVKIIFLLITTNAKQWDDLVISVRHFSLCTSSLQTLL